MNNREIICIHIGQAGIQIGSAVWELLSIEHELDDNGYQICYCPWPLMDNTNSLYFEVGDGKFKPRSLMIDSESLVIEEIRTGCWNKMFDVRSLISGKEDASTIFAKGYNLCANDVLNDSLTYLRILMEETSCLNGFLLFHSLGGGTGSGLTSRIAEVIQSEAPKKSMIHLSIVPPTNKSGFIVEPYNGVLATAALLESSSLMCMMENQALYEAVDHIINHNKLSFVNINRHIAQITSSLTTSYRFANKLSSDFSVFQTNLVPFPEIHFPIVSYAQAHDTSELNLTHMTKSCYMKEKMVLKLDPDLGSFMSCCLLYRGMNCAPMAINNAIKTIKMDSNNKFVDWSPTSFKVAINVQMPGFIPCADIPETKQSLCLLSNSTAIIQQWIKLLDNFQNLFSRKAFLHWFVAEGVDESILKDAEDRIIDIISKYRDLDTNKDLSYLNKHKPNREAAQFLKRINPDTQAKEKMQTKFATETRKISEDQENKNEAVKSNKNDDQVETADDISISHNQFNISSKYKQSRLEQSLSKNPTDSICDSESNVDSMFIKSKTCSYQSLKAINSLHGSTSTVSSKERSFSHILHQSILDLPHLVNGNKVPSVHSSISTKNFLSQFCRLNSRSQESICNNRNHSCQLNYSIDNIKNDSILYAQVTNEKHCVVNQTTDFQENEYSPCKMSVFPTKIQMTSQLRASIFQSQMIESIKINQTRKTFHDIKHSQDIEIELVSPDKRSEIACQTNDRKSITSRLSRILSRRSTIGGSKKLKEIPHRRHSLQKNLTPTIYTLERSKATSTNTQQN